MGIIIACILLCTQMIFAHTNTEVHRDHVSKPVVLPPPVLKKGKNLHTPHNIQKSHASSKKSQKMMVVIDPGHGGKDSGAIGPMGIKEKMVVLAISKMVVQCLNQDSHYQGVLTRSTDIYLPLRQRLAIARRYKPDLFIAIHADAAYQNSAIGASVFALSERGATSEMARWLAQKENQSELVDGLFVEKDRVLRSVLLDLSMPDKSTLPFVIACNDLPSNSWKKDKAHSSTRSNNSNTSIPFFRKISKWGLFLAALKVSAII